MVKRSRKSDYTRRRIVACIRMLRGEQQLRMSTMRKAARETNWKPTGCTWHRDNTRLVFVKMQRRWLKIAIHWCELRGIEH